MPLEIKDVKDGLGFVILGSGVLTEHELVDGLKKHLTQDKEKFKKIRYTLTDYTALTEADISSKALELIAGFCIEAAYVNPEIIVAEVASQDFYYGLVRMSHALRDRHYWENAVFRNRQDAEDWIKQRVKEKYGIDDITFD